MKKLIKLILFSVVLFSLAGCGFGKQQTDNPPETSQPSSEEVSPETPESASSDSNAGSKGSKLVIAMNTTKTLNPLYNTQSNVEQALYLIFSPLVNIEENGSISGNLAESWVVNENQTAVTITLRQGLRWHDGTPLTSDDVIFTLNQIAKIPDCPYKQAIENMQGTEKVDDQTFKIIYRQSFSSVLQTLFFPVIPEHIYNVEGSDTMSIVPVGSGPYRYESMTPLESIHLKANTDYFKGAPKIQEIQINLIPDKASGLYSFKQGLIDMVYTTETEWGKYTNSSNNSAYEMVSPIYEFMGVNFNQPVFQSAGVRNALVYALNREEIVRLYYLDHAVVTDTPISPASYLYNKNLETKNYDKEKARYLLTQEGYELDVSTGYMTKNGQPFSFTVLVNKENTDRVKVAKEMQKMYAEVGIHMQIEEVDKATYLNRLTSRQFEAFLGGWQLSYAVDLSFAFRSSSVLGGQNYMNYQDAKMDTLLQQAFLAPHANITNAYYKLQDYFEESMPCVSLYFKKSVLMMKNTIQGPIKPTPLNVFANVEQWTI